MKTGPLAERLAHPTEERALKAANGYLRDGFAARVWHDPVKGTWLSEAWEMPSQRAAFVALANES